jgi:hypothetical protein
VRENDSGQVFVANLSVEPIDSMGAFNAHFSYVPAGLVDVRY